MELITHYCPYPDSTTKSQPNCPTNYKPNSQREPTPNLTVERSIRMIGRSKTCMIIFDKNAKLYNFVCNAKIVKLYNFVPCPRHHSYDIYSPQASIQGGGRQAGQQGAFNVFSSTHEGTNKTGEYVCTEKEQ